MNIRILFKCIQYFFSPVICKRQRLKESLSLISNYISILSFVFSPLTAKWFHLMFFLFVFSFRLCIELKSLGFSFTNYMLFSLSSRFILSISRNKQNKKKKRFTSIQVNSKNERRQEEKTILAIANNKHLNVKKLACAMSVCATKCIRFSYMFMLG